MDETQLFPVRILLRDEMYPKYNFLKRRLLSVYPRFKAIIEKGELCDLIPDGIKLFDQIDRAQDKFKGPPVIYMIGNHNAVTEASIETNLLVSTKGTPEEFQIVKKAEPEFKTAIKGIAEMPSVIVQVIDTDDDDNKQAFTGTTRNLVLLLPPRDRDSCVLTNKDFNRFNSLTDFNINKSFSELASVAKLIQTCLEEKVVKVLKMIQEFIQSFYPDDLIEEGSSGQEPGPSGQERGPSPQEPLAITMTKSLQKTINEHSLNQEMDEVGRGRGFECAMSWYLCRNLETQICQNISKTYKVRPNVAHEFLYKVNFDEEIKEKVEEDPNVFKKAPFEIQQFYDNFAAQMSDQLYRFEEEIKNTLPLISKLLPRIDFEINGIFRQAKLDTSPLPKLPIDLKKEILRLEGVYGCGLLYGNLAVHVRPETSLREVTDRIKCVVKNLGQYNYMDRLQVRPVRPSRTAGVTYESGRSLRVQKAQDQTDGTQGLNADRYSFGTLGCFVKGKYNGPNADNYTERMYALSCAHVFPQGCGNFVEINQAGSVFNAFGIVSEELTILKEHTLDIAAIVVDSMAIEKCNVRLKNTNSFEGWESDLYTGEISDLVGFEVFKFGSVSDLTQGIVVGHEFHYQVQGLDSLDENYNILIEPIFSEEFSKEGESGSLVCLENPEEEKVIALSMINGALYIPECNGTEQKYLCTNSCHLYKNIQELSKKTNIRFKWYREFPETYDDDNEKYESDSSNLGPKKEKEKMHISESLPNDEKEPKKKNSKETHEGAEAEKITDKEKYEKGKAKIKDYGQHSGLGDTENMHLPLNLMIDYQDQGKEDSSVVYHDSTLVHMFHEDTSVEKDIPMMAVQEKISEALYSKNRSSAYKLLQFVAEYIRQGDKENIVEVWPAYEEQKQWIPIFVVLTRNGSSAKYYKLGNFSVFKRRYDLVSQEAVKVMTSKQIQADLTDDNDFKKGNSAINSAEAKNVLDAHSNITIMNVCSCRSKMDGMVIEKEMCIVIHCLVKGLIPFCEKPFPKSISGIPIDVREGYAKMGMYRGGIAGTNWTETSTATSFGGLSEDSNCDSEKPSVRKRSTCDYARTGTLNINSLTTPPVCPGPLPMEVDDEPLQDNSKDESKPFITEMEEFVIKAQRHFIAQFRKGSFSFLQGTRSGPRALISMTLGKIGLSFELCDGDSSLLKDDCTEVVRYSHHSLAFYIGTLDDAIEGSFNRSANERKKLAMYLHHNNNIFAATFYPVILCDQSVVDYLSFYTIWPWDCTEASNTATLMTMLTSYFDEAETKKIGDELSHSLPVLLVICQAGDSNKVADVIKGNVTKEQLIERLQNEDERQKLEPKSKNPKLLMGTRISTDAYSSTLAGFVHLSGGEIGFLTCAHAVCKEGQRVYQPSLAALPDGHSLNGEPYQHDTFCGYVDRCVFEPGQPGVPGVDAAVVRITDRCPTDGDFIWIPTERLLDAGFSSALKFSSGKFMPETEVNRRRQQCVIKIGSETGLTRGCLNAHGSTVKTKDLLGTSETKTTYFYGIKEVQSDTVSTPVFKDGDSGSLVFMSKGKDDELFCIGLAIGSTSYNSFLFTPISVVLDKLNLKFVDYQAVKRRNALKNAFKVFLLLTLPLLLYYSPVGYLFT